jgi:hypothetical protein
MKQTDRPNQQTPNGRDRPIVYHEVLAKAFEAWAAEIGAEPAGLRRETEAVIRDRASEARLAGEINPAPDHPQPVYELPLDACVVYFSIESGGAVVRGYGWEIAGAPRDDFDGGGFWW